MFNSLFAEETGHANVDKTERGASTSGTDASTSAPANPLLNFWSVATAVTNTVKARADELVKSVVDTDWRSELSQFSKEVGEESKTLKEKTAEIVEQLPEQVVHLPEKAEEALQQLPAQVHLPKDVGQTLEGVSGALASFGKSLLLGTKELIDELKEGVESEISVATREGKRAGRAKSSATAATKLSAVQAKYNRFEAEVASMQRDSSTYCDEPEDAEDYARWKAGFSQEGVRSEIARIIAENAFMAELQSRLVPIIVEPEDFWSRYFYRLHKLQQKEEQRQQLAQRAKSLQEDDVPLGWGDDDEAPPASSPTVSAAAAAAAASEVPVPPPAEAAAASEASELTAALTSTPTMTAATPAPPEEAAAASAPGPSDTEPTGEQSEARSPRSSPAAAAAEPAPGAPEATAAAPHPSLELAPSGTGSKAQSGGGASEPGSSAHVEVDPNQLESEPHAETASDSSAKEWCVVTSDAQQQQQQATAVGAATAGACDELEPAQAPASATGADAVAPAVVTEASSQPAAEEPESEAEGAAANAPVGAKAAKRAAPGAKGPAAGAQKNGDDEEVDEDWGNWD